FWKVYRKETRIVEASPPQVAVPMDPELDPKLAAYLQEQTACIVGRKLMQKAGWKLGQTIPLAGTIYPGEWPLTIRGVYSSVVKTFGEETMFFPFRYLDQKGMDGQS